MQQNNPTNCMILFVLHCRYHIIKYETQITMKNDSNNLSTVSKNPYSEIEIQA